MIKPTTEILREAIGDLSDTIDYVVSESGDTNISQWLKEVEVKLAIVYRRLTDPVVQQKED